MCSEPAKAKGMGGAWDHMVITATLDSAIGIGTLNGHQACDLDPLNHVKSP
jgi:hypothetical protein